MIYPEIVDLDTLMQEGWEIIPGQLPSSLNKVVFSKKQIIIPPNHRNGVKTALVLEEEKCALAKIALNLTDEDEKGDFLDIITLHLSVCLWLEEVAGLQKQGRGHLINVCKTLDNYILHELSYLDKLNYISFPDDPKGRMLYCIYEQLGPSANDNKFASKEARTFVAKILRELLPGAAQPDNRVAKPGQNQVRVRVFSTTDENKEISEAQENEILQKIATKLNQVSKNIGKPHRRPPEDQDCMDYGAMCIVEPELVSVPIFEYQDKLRKGKRASEAGDIPVRFDRYVHNSVFKTTGKSSYSKGGTVLVDCSGSMSLTQQDLMAIIIAAPFCTVAGYHGRLQDGDLFIMARNGRIVDLSKLDWPGENVIDGPAIRWLNQQRAPRIYVGDLQFTTSGQKTASLQTYRGTVKMLLKGNCVVIRSVETAKKALRNRQVLERLAEASTKGLTQLAHTGSYGMFPYSTY